MKLSLIFGLASSATASIRTRRSMQSVYSMTGEEDVQFLDNLLANVTLNTIDEIELEIARNSPFMRRETDIEMRKFRNLKVLVLWLQNIGAKYGKKAPPTHICPMKTQFLIQLLSLS